MRANKRVLPPDFHANAMKYFADRVAEANAGVTHAEFVAGVRDGTIAFICPAHQMSML
jgi:hypothetical protein